MKTGSSIGSAKLASLAPDACAGVPAGVNVGGYLRTESGVGSAARRCVRALRFLGIPVALKDASAVSGNRAKDLTLTAFDAEHPHGVNIVCGDVERHFALMAQLGEGFFRGRYNIGMWAWELPRFPEKWYDRFAYYDEVWAGSSFVANALAPVSPLPVVRVPPVLTAEAPGSRVRGRQRLGASDEEYVFLFVFDVNSHLERKNPLAVVEAFARAFAPLDPARMVIKTVNAASDAEGFTTLRERARGFRVYFHDGYWPAEEMRDLMAACDAYVSLHRSEGIGLTIGDAMALGKPVVATGWSGNMDFMNVSNSFPVRYELVEITRRVGPYAGGEVWAEPSVEHAAELMRLVFADRRRAEACGHAARREIEADYSEEAVGRLIRERLRVIAGRRRFGRLKRALREPVPDVAAFLDEFQDVGRFVPGGHLRYRLLLGRIAEVVRTTLPPDAAVLVVSRGDEALLRLGGRPGWHFPQAEGGAYAGHNPADSGEAISHLEGLRAAGATHLLFPATALWWLDYYDDFRRHLESHHRAVVRQDEVCTIFALSRDHGRTAPGIQWPDARAP
jgi:glycosyltransferase involved in cell wall biosynthesis